MFGPRSMKIDFYTNLNRKLYFHVWSQHPCKGCPSGVFSKNMGPDGPDEPKNTCQKFRLGCLIFSFDPHIFSTPTHQDFVWNLWVQMGQNRLGKKMVQECIKSHWAWMISINKNFWRHPHAFLFCLVPTTGFRMPNKILFQIYRPSTMKTHLQKKCTGLDKTQLGPTSFKKDWLGDPIWTLKFPTAANIFWKDGQ